MLPSLQYTDENNKDYSRSSYRTVRRADNDIDNKNATIVDPLYVRIYKTARNVPGGIVDVAKDFWWDFGNDKYGYSLKLLVGTTAGFLGGISAGPVGAAIGTLIGFSMASAAHYTERRFYDSDYRKKKEEMLKKQGKQL